MKNIKAFSLLESVFCLFLIGIFSSIILTYYKINIFSYKKSLTIFRANYVRKVIEGYVATHGFLPYCALSLNGTQINNCTVGYLPYRTLGIDRSYALDGFKRPFVFIVNGNFVKNFHSKKGYFVAPCFFPVNNFTSKIRSFSRINLYHKTRDNTEIESVENCMFLWDYDQLNSEFNINLIKNGQKIQLSHVNVYPIFDASFFSLSNQYDKLEEYRKFYKIQDCICWAIISDNNVCPKEIDDTDVVLKLEDYFLVFWQSRFNLCAQIGCPVVVSSTYIGYFLDSYLLKKFKYI